jgi:hypothetical protein
LAARRRPVAGGVAPAALGVGWRPAANALLARRAEARRGGAAEFLRDVYKRQLVELDAQVVAARANLPTLLGRRLRIAQKQRTNIGRI